MTVHFKSAIAGATALVVGVAMMPGAINSASADGGINNLGRYTYDAPSNFVLPDTIFDGGKRLGEWQWQ